MVSQLGPGEVLIHDGNYRDFLAPVVGGERKGHGLVPRDYRTHPVGRYAWATAVDFPLIPRSEWSARIKQMEAEKSRLSDIRMTAGPSGGMIPSRDQNGRGYCWAHSGVSAHLMARAVMGEPYADLSAYAIACIIKNYADDGGWGAQGVDWQVQNGCPTSQYWPQQSAARSNDNAAMRANAAQHKIIAQWADLNAAEYDRDLTFDQVATLLLSRVPVVVDYNWWSHSVCAVDLVETSPGQFGVRIWNSWGDDWSDHGMGVLDPTKAVPDGAVAPRLVMASPG
jgi:hypothetical protein